jgi:hypothetical protein
MRLRRFLPDLFTVGMLVLGVILMVFPSLRVAGLISVSLAMIYWLLMAVLRAAQR